VTTLFSSLNSAWLGISPLIIKLIIVLFLLFIGLLIAKGLAYLAKLVFKVVDGFTKQIGFDSILEKGKIKKSASELIGDLVYWVVVFVVIIGVLNAAGLQVEQALNRVFAYMGIVFLAALVLGIGVFLAVLVSSIVRVIMANLGLEGSRAVSRVIYYIVIIFAFLAALSELGFNPRELAPHLGVIIGFPALAAAIAFGLGCKDMAADFLHNLFKGK